MKIKVREMPRASLLEDGSLVELQFKSIRGPVTLVFDPDDLERFASRSVELIREAQNRRRASAGHFVSVASDVVAAGADAPIGGGKVILLLRATNGIVQQFGLTPSQSAELRPQLEDAELKAAAGAAQPRH